MPSPLKLQTRDQRLETRKMGSITRKMGTFLILESCENRNVPNFDIDQIIADRCAKHLRDEVKKITQENA